MSDLIFFVSGCFVVGQFSIFFCWRLLSTRLLPARLTAHRARFRACTDAKAAQNASLGSGRIRRERKARQWAGGGASICRPRPRNDLRKRERESRSASEGEAGREGVLAWPSRAPKGERIPSHAASRPRRSLIATSAAVVPSGPRRGRPQGRLRGQAGGLRDPVDSGKELANRKKKSSEGSSERLLRVDHRRNFTLTFPSLFPHLFPPSSSHFRYLFFFFSLFFSRFSSGPFAPFPSEL